MLQTLEKSEDTKVVTKSCKLKKDRAYVGQIERDTETNNGSQNITQKTKI